MSAAASTDLLQQVVVLEQRAVALKRALVVGRWVRTGMLLALASLAIYFAWSFLALGRHLQSQSNIDQVLKLAEARLSERSDEYLKEVQTLVDDATPVLSAAFSARMKKDIPSYMDRLGQERKVFEENLQVKLETYVEKQQAKLLVNARGLLEKEFPEAADGKLHGRMFDNLKVAIHELTQKYYVESLKRGLQQLYADWDDFPVAPQAEEGDVPLEDQLVADLLDVLTTKLTQSGRATTGVDEAVRPGLQKTEQ